MACRRSSRWLLLIMLNALLVASVPMRSSGKTGPTAGRRAVTLWVRQVHGQALYWIDEKPVRRAPLTGLEIAIHGIDPDEVALTVILDRRVPTGEIFEIDGMLDKIPIKNVRYFVFDASDPHRMWEIFWKPDSVPLPGPPPLAAR